MKYGADGVGLFRSEFLFMDRDALPTEDEQFEAYRTAAQTMAGKPLIIRTLDVGGDKKLPTLELPHEDNPFLGFRAIRMTLSHPEIFRPAAARHSPRGCLWRRARHVPDDRLHGSAPRGKGPAA